jgi:1-acyl-sn-glycerol-3-phosphate acyltransferase
MIFNPEISIPNNLELKKPVLIIANHNHRLDPFLLTLLPFSLIRKLIPVYFPTAEVYHKNILLSFLIRPLGSYPIKRWSWSFESIFDKTLKDLQKKKTTLIFPEGQIVRDGKKTRAKSGFLFLSLKSRATIIPIKFKTKNRLGIKVGKSIKLDTSKRISHEKEANKIMKNLYKM